jgi:hypothetical protein
MLVAEGALVSYLVGARLRKDALSAALAALVYFRRVHGGGLQVVGGWVGKCRASVGVLILPHYVYIYI